MNISTLFPRSTEIIEQQKTLQNHLDKVFISELKAFILALPGISGIEWLQYTPYFNDGEPCNFTVYGVNVYLDATSNVIKDAILANPELKNEFHALDDYEGDLENPEEYFLQYQHRVKNLITPELKEILDKAFQLEQILDRCAKTLESAFGDGFRVKLTKTGITTKEYSHD